MVVILKSGASREELMKVSRKLKLQTKKKDLRRWCGIIKLKEDALTIQKKMRDEWK